MIEASALVTPFSSKLLLKLCPTLVVGGISYFSILYMLFKIQTPTHLSHPQKTNFHRIYSRPVQPHNRHNLREEYGKRRSQTAHESSNAVGDASAHNVDELFDDAHHQAITLSGGAGIVAGRDYDTELTFTDLRAHLIPPTPPPRHNASHRLGCLKLAMTTQSPKNTGSIDDSDGAGSIITTTTTTTTASMGRRGFGRSHTIDYDDDDDDDDEHDDVIDDDVGTVPDEADDDYPYSNYVADADDPFRLMDDGDSAAQHGSAVTGDSSTSSRHRRLERTTKSYLNNVGDFEQLEMAGCSSAPAEDERHAYQTTDMFDRRPEIIRRGPQISWPIIGHRHSSHYETTPSGNDALTVTTAINQRASFHGRGQTSFSRCLIVYE